ncbi:MAG: hypothetical protein NVS1B14_11470 [Vulcanimicrobiaceae bacterium]
MAGFFGASAQSTLPLEPSPPPGKIAQDVTAYLAGDAMHSRYRAITSRVRMPDSSQDQWYFSLYAQNGDEDFRRIFESPSASDSFNLVPKLERPPTAPRYFPNETVRVAGRGEFMGEARDQVLLLVHESSADCGMSTLSVLSSEPGPGPVVVPVQVSNPCSLSVAIAHHTIVLRGPYYKANAPRYKPTKNNATATLRYVDAHWVERPEYFRLVYPRAPAITVTPLTASPTPFFTPIFKAILTTPAPSGAPQPPRG